MLAYYNLEYVGELSSFSLTNFFYKNRMNRLQTMARNNRKAVRRLAIIMIMLHFNWVPPIKPGKQLKTILNDPLIFVIPCSTFLLCLKHNLNINNDGSILNLVALFNFRCGH